MKNSKTIGFTESNDVKYFDDGSEDYGKTTAKSLIGSLNARNENIFMVLTNMAKICPIVGNPCTIGDVSYQTGRKGWKDRTEALL